MISILDNKINKQKCQTFTPANMVENMLDIAGYNKNLAGKKILENSFGSGNFLAAIVKRYIRDCMLKGFSLHIISQGLEHDIFGIEIDKRLYEACIRKLNLIVEAYNIPPVKWKLYNIDALFWESSTKFDFIIGNPPYITYNDIDENTRYRIRNKYLSCNLGKFDYCYAFIEQGIDLLNSSGKLVQLVPATIYKNVFGKKLRELLCPHVSLIEEYPGQELFEGVLTSSTVFLYDKLYSSNIIKYIDVTSNKISFISRESLGEKWIFSKQIENVQKGVRFGDCFHASTVVATQFNNAFVLTEDIIKNNKIEAEIIRKAASPKRMRMGVQEYIIFPYYYKNDLLMHYDKKVFENKYPNTIKYLNKYRTQLDQRKKDKKAKWFEYGRSQALSHLNQKKVLLSNVITKKVELYFLDEDTIPYSGIFIVVKNKNFSLDSAIEILQSNCFLEYVQSIGTSVSGNSKRITCKDINNYYFMKE